MGEIGVVGKAVGVGVEFAGRIRVDVRWDGERNKGDGERVEAQRTSKC